MSWTQLPRFGADDAIKVARRPLEERHHHYSATERQATAQWLLHMVKLKFVTLEQIAAAMSQQYPFSALYELTIEVECKLARHLDSVVERHSLGDEQGHKRGITATFNYREGDDPTVAFYTDHSYLIEINSLHCVPRRLAKMVYNSLFWVSYCLLPCLLPADTWGPPCNYYSEIIGDGYSELKKHGIARDSLSIAKFLQKHYHEEGTFDDSESLAWRVTEYRLREFGRPAWMRTNRSRKPISNMKRLRHAARQYQLEHGPQPWAEYVCYVCDVLCARFASDRAVKSWRKKQQEHYDSYADENHGAGPIGYGFLVTSGTWLEQEHCDELMMELSETGTRPYESYSLTSLASKAVLAILEARAMGLGLLLRAEAIHHQAARSEREHLQ